MSNLFIPLPSKETILIQSNSSLDNQFNQSYQAHTTESTSSPSPRKRRQTSFQNCRSSSTSSIFLNNSIINFDIKSLIRGISIILQMQIQENTKLNKQISPNSDLFFFSEEKYIQEKFTK